MSNPLINKISKQKQKARPALLFMLFALFLLTTCPVKRSINYFLVYTGVENEGSNTEKPALETGKYLTSSCAFAVQESVIPVTTSTRELLPTNLTLLSGLSSHAGVINIPDIYLSEVLFHKTPSPVYLRNLRLLI